MSFFRSSIDTKHQHQHQRSPSSSSSTSSLFSSTPSLVSSASFTSGTTSTSSPSPSSPFPPHISKQLDPNEKELTPVTLESLRILDVCFRALRTLVIMRDKREKEKEARRKQQLRLVRQQQSRSSLDNNNNTRRESIAPEDPNPTPHQDRTIVFTLNHIIWFSMCVLYRMFIPVDTTPSTSTSTSTSTPRDNSTQRRSDVDVTSPMSPFASFYGTYFTLPNVPQTTTTNVSSPSASSPTSSPRLSSSRASPLFRSIPISSCTNPSCTCTCHNHSSFSPHSPITSSPTLSSHTHTIPITPSTPSYTIHDNTYFTYAVLENIGLIERELVLLRDREARAAQRERDRRVKQQAAWYQTMRYPRSTNDTNMIHPRSNSLSHLQSTTSIASLGMDELEDSPLLSSITCTNHIPSLTALTSTSTPTVSSQAMEMVRNHFRDLYSSSSHPFGHAIASLLLSLSDPHALRLRASLHHAHHVAAINQHVAVKEEARRERIRRWSRELREDEDEDDVDVVVDGNGMASTVASPTSLSASSSTSSSTSTSSIHSSSSSSSSSSPPSPSDHAILSSSIRTHLTFLTEWTRTQHRLILSCYPHLAQTILCKKISSQALATCVMDAMAPTLTAWYAYLESAADKALWLKLRQLRGLTMREMGVPDAFIPPSSDSDIHLHHITHSQPYADTRTLLMAFNDAPLIRTKLSLIVLVCRSITEQARIIAEQRQSHISSTPPSPAMRKHKSTIIITTDDLIPTLAWCLCHIDITTLHSQTQMLLHVIDENQ